MNNGLTTNQALVKLTALALTTVRYVVDDNYIEGYMQRRDLPKLKAKFAAQATVVVNEVTSGHELLEREGIVDPVRFRIMTLRGPLDRPQPVEDEEEAMRRAGWLDSWTRVQAKPEPEVNPMEEAIFSPDSIVTVAIGLNRWDETVHLGFIKAQAANGLMVAEENFSFREVA